MKAEWKSWELRFLAILLLLFAVSRVECQREPRLASSDAAGEPGAAAAGFAVRDSIAGEQESMREFQRQINQTVSQLRQLVDQFEQLVVTSPGQVPEACSQLPQHFQQMYNDVTFIKARTEIIGLELRSRVDNLWVHSRQEFARVQQQLEVLLEDRDAVPRAVNVLVSLQDNLYSDSSPQTLLFDQQISNLAEGYDQHSGHFRCPVSGIYIFNLGLSVAQGDGVQAKLLHNGVTRLHLQLPLSGHLYSAGVSMQCREGENVWVELTHQSESETPVQLNADCYMSGALVSSLQSA